MNTSFLKRTKRVDGLARWLITLGGISIIGSMLVLILFMFKVTLPLFDDPKGELRGYFKLDEGQPEPVLFAPGPYLQQGFALRPDGALLVFSLSDGKVLQRLQLEPPNQAATTISNAWATGKERYNILWDDGSLTLEECGFSTHFDEASLRSILFHHKRLGAAHIPTSASRNAAVLHSEDDGVFCLAYLSDRASITIEKNSVSEDFLGNVSEEKTNGLIEPEVAGALTALAMSVDGSRLYAASDAGELLAWNTTDASAPVLLDSTRVSSSTITSMALLFGEVSLVVGEESGRLSAWNLIPGKVPRLGRIHDFVAHEAPVTSLTTSYKDKSFLSMDSDGQLHLNHLTSERLLLRFSTETPLKQVALADRGDGLLAMDGNASFWWWDLMVPHPEISAKTLWGKVHYEGYPEPVTTWQSSSASDDFEAKLSLVPLLFGSLKGTFYGMLFSLPLAFFAALYTSYMMHPRWRAVVKPTIELMAAVPSVVTGFLAALWLAPRLEYNLIGLGTAILILPLFTGAGLFWLFRRKRKLTGLEFLYSFPLLLLGAWLAFHLGGLLQEAFFNDNLNLWLYQKMGFDVDQRNCVVIGFALGFAVIPIIFTISEDALYNVPKHLSAGALALGSSRWQAMRRVILPMASPGIFAGVMIGLGRAVGETMIVLMATGNTPIISPSMLNGMRTLSANIAVEIPEAPVDSTLYRVLFLSAVLLFSLTFVVNTLAEVVSTRLKKRYKNL